jgi:hypothetical protein
MSQKWQSCKALAEGEAAAHPDANNDHRILLVSVRYGELTAEGNYPLLAGLSRSPSRKRASDKYEFSATYANKGSHRANSLDCQPNEFKPPGNAAIRGYHRTHRLKLIPDYA